MYLDVMRPRNFDANDLQTELPGDVIFQFCYESFVENSQDASKLLIKDIKTVSTSLK